MLIAATTFVELFDCDILADLVEYFDELGLDADAKTSATNYLLANRDGRVEVRYRQAAPGGRWYAINGLSLQSMNRRLRHTICGSKYQDIDMVNAEPNIIQHLCR